MSTATKSTRLGNRTVVFHSTPRDLTVQDLSGQPTVRISFTGSIVHDHGTAVSAANPDDFTTGGTSQTVSFDNRIHVSELLEGHDQHAVTAPFRWGNVIKALQKKSREDCKTCSKLPEGETLSSSNIRTERATAAFETTDALMQCSEGDIQRAPGTISIDCPMDNLPEWEEEQITYAIAVAALSGDYPCPGSGCDGPQHMHVINDARIPDELQEYFI
ncbi:uncharacterized protein I303_101885 [Kwoniella dejecticola CBS 10117]|uniref:Uncharacterized protein n=1 Tax=Kwoniella dejecticola CBS 10117 TaxID=1296121 RepID=A0A1A6ACI2_9TREE|nr:uncharacterized protein I303_01978 [Kwoniella dejecticola CBS 10117]OBR87766.1 hypothetical protein I303_01978 [Kwoniella dejecticola CBS 10117]